VLGLFASSACSSTVFLGAECASGRCQGDGDGLDIGDGDGDGDARADGGSGMGEPDDSGQAPDSGGMLDASPQLPDGSPGPGADDSGSAATLTPDFFNPSFERINGSPAGDLADFALGTGPDISPWKACQTDFMAGFLRAEQSRGDVRPSDGDTFLNFGFPYFAALPIPLYQRLATPMRAGQRYAFVVELRAEDPLLDEQLAVIIRGGNVGCNAFNDTLGMTPYQKNGAWVSHCIAFTAASDMNEISFVPRVKSGLGPTSHLYIDNIHADPSCQ
jgi:hypothetical protein